MLGAKAAGVATGITGARTNGAAAGTSLAPKAGTLIPPRARGDELRRVLNEGAGDGGFIAGDASTGALFKGASTSIERGVELLFRFFLSTPKKTQPFQLVPVIALAMTERERWLSPFQRKPSARATTS